MQNYNNQESIDEENFFVGDLEITKDEKEFLDVRHKHFEDDVLVKEDYFVGIY